jgi:hypothetical protein
MRRQRRKKGLGERGRRRRMGPALASVSAAEGATKGTAARLATPDNRSQRLVRQLLTPAVTQPETPRPVPAQISSSRTPRTAINMGEEKIIGLITDSALTSLRSSVIGSDDDADEDDDDDNTTQEVMSKLTRRTMSKQHLQGVLYSEAIASTTRMRTIT